MSEKYSARLSGATELFPQVEADRDAKFPTGKLTRKTITQIQHGTRGGLAGAPFLACHLRPPRARAEIGAEFYFQKEAPFPACF